jgi:hypothetical protein
MQYVHILALIDAELERLKEVRLLLTTLDTPLKGAQKKAPNPLVRSKTLRMAEKQKPTAPALLIDKHEVSQRKKPAPPAMRLKKPALSNPSAASFAKAFPPAVSESALALDDQIRQEQPQGQRAPVVEESVFSQMATIPPVARVRTRRKSRALSKLSVTPLATPLGGPVPTEPIFIPAEMIHPKQSRNRQESVAERGAAGPPAVVPLTAELLTQRWIQGSVTSAGAGATRSSGESRLLMMPAAK